jgi:hypothetical protein
VRSRLEHDLDARLPHAVERANTTLGLGGDLLPERTRGRSEAEADEHVPSLDFDLVHHPEPDDVEADLGVRYVAERFERAIAEAVVRSRGGRHRSVAGGRSLGTL